jgi:two-component system phosphate regulon sensor histidine kinase PhoR
LPWLLCIILLTALIALHLWWRKTFDQDRARADRRLQELDAAHQQAAVQQKAQQDALFDSMVEGLLVLDEQGRIQVANRAFVQLFGLKNDRRSQTIMEALRSNELTEVVDRLKTEKFVIDHEMQLPGPTERWIQISGAGLFNGDGRRHGSILAFHDLTRLKQLENARKEFVANVSHELRTPLSLIKGYSETLIDGAKDNPDVALKFLQTIERNADRLKLLIEDLLTISELESGRVTLNLQMVDLQLVADRVLEDFKSRASEKNVTLLNETPALQISADAIRLEQVFGNLIDNAIKYGRPNGTVRVGASLPDSVPLSDARPERMGIGGADSRNDVTASPLETGEPAGSAPAPPSEERAGERRPFASNEPSVHGKGRGGEAHRSDARFIEIFVRDDGPGIPTDSLPRVFERFYRVDKARSREQGGTGLGLSIVKHVVQAHGGRVWATSELGTGTTFFFTLSAAHIEFQQTLL